MMMHLLNIVIGQSYVKQTEGIDESHPLLNTRMVPNTYHFRLNPVSRGCLVVGGMDWFGI